MGGVIITVVWILVLLLFLWTLVRGEPLWLQHPANTAQQLCGTAGSTAQLPYLFWPDYTATGQSYCVSACPTSTGGACSSTRRTAAACPLQRGLRNSSRENRPFESKLLL